MKRDRHALVIGGGLAGATTAAALARRGWRVIVVDVPDAGASAIPAAVMAPPPLPGNDHVTAWRRRGAAVTGAWLRRLEQRGGDCGVLGHGVLLLARRARQHRRWARLPAGGPGPVRVAADRGAALAGVTPPGEAVFHPGGAWLRPATLCAALRAHAGIEWAPGRVERLERRGPGWAALGADGGVLAAARVAVVAAGMDSARLLPAAGALIPARGQATAIAPAGPVRSLRLALSGGGYVAPVDGDRCWIGATLDRYRDGIDARAADDTRNLELHARLWPDAPAPRIVGRFAAVRATTRDRLPLVGPVGQDLWISAGHGTQGLLSAPLSALLLAEAVDRGRAHPLARRLDPARTAAAARIATATGAAGPRARRRAGEPP